MWKKFKQWVWNILIAIDQLVNTIFGGDPDETISSRVGKDADKNKFAAFMVKFLDIFEKEHCEKSKEDDEGKNNAF